MVSGKNNMDEIREKMETYISGIRPPENMRRHLDVGYRLEESAIILFETLPLWNSPHEMESYDYAKAIFIKGNSVWKIYWKKAKGTWTAYEPQPEVATLEEFLALVDKDEHYLFKG